MVDAHASGACSLTGVEVQLLSSAQTFFEGPFRPPKELLENSKRIQIGSLARSDESYHPNTAMFTVAHVSRQW